MTQSEIFGRGFAFPFAFDANTGGVQRRKGIESVEDSLIFIIGTFMSERLMQPNFGSRLSQAVFELETPDRLALLKSYITEAVRQEPRVQQVTSIGIAQDPRDEHALLVTVEYQVIHQTDRRNLVLPLLRA